MRRRSKLRLKESVSEDFKMAIFMVIFTLTCLRLFEVLILPTSAIISEKVVLGIVLAAVTYLWAQEVRNKKVIRIRDRELSSSQEVNLAAMKALVVAEEAREPYLNGHSQRVTEYALVIADRLKISEEEKKHIEYAGYLHDIGKIGITDAILHKKGKLTEQEWAVIKRHPEGALEMLAPLNFSHEKTIIKHHHERYDGTGYPDGLKDGEIPLGSRIIAIVDAFDAMNSMRPYRSVLPKEKIISELKNSRGTQFDPELVDIFMDIISTDDSFFKRLS